MCAVFVVVFLIDFGSEIAHAVDIHLVALEIQRILTQYIFTCFGLTIRNNVVTIVTLSEEYGIAKDCRSLGGCILTVRLYMVVFWRGAELVLSV